MRPEPAAENHGRRKRHQEGTIPSDHASDERCVFGFAFYPNKPRPTKNRHPVGKYAWLLQHLSILQKEEGPWDGSKDRHSGYLSYNFHASISLYLLGSHNSTADTDDADIVPEPTVPQPQPQASQNASRPQPNPRQPLSHHASPHNPPPHMLNPTTTASSSQAFQARLGPPTHFQPSMQTSHATNPGRPPHFQLSMPTPQPSIQAPINAHIVQLCF